MENITSLNSPHIERVKALIGSRGKKNRELENAFVAEGIQVVREALSSKMPEGLAVKKVYVTEEGLSRLSADIGDAVLSKFEIIQVKFFIKVNFRSIKISIKNYFFSFVGELLFRIINEDMQKKNIAEFVSKSEVI
jgi:hypothetical protein